MVKRNQILDTVRKVLWKLHESFHIVEEHQAIIFWILWSLKTVKHIPIQQLRELIPSDLLYEWWQAWGTFFFFLDNHTIHQNTSSFYEI